MADFALLLGRYRVVRKLGSGAFATVYLADDLKMGRPVAIKVVEHAADVEDRVIREAQAAAKLSHPHILTVYEMVREPERTYLITEYIQGKTLREHYRDQTLTDLELVEVGIQLCRALEHAHRRGVIHRDIKPENIMLLEGDIIDVRLMDFGVAQLEDRVSITLDGELVGTLAYMSPEQLEGQTVDSRSDIYSLALTLYEGFTQKNPRRGRRLQELLRDMSRPELPPLVENRPDLPLELSGVLERAMARDRYARPDAAQLGRALARVSKMMPEPEGVTEESPTERMPTRPRTRFELPLAAQERLFFMGEHVASGAFALACLAYVLPKVPFYPGASLIPLVAGVSFFALLWPFGGGTVALAVLTPPIFAHGIGWGALYSFLAALTMGLLRWQRKEWAVLLPGAALLLAPWGLGLALLPLAGASLRRWGPWVGFLHGLLLAVAGSLAGWSLLPYTYTPAPGRVLDPALHAVSPATVLLEVSRLLDRRPELALQILVLTVFSLPLYLFWGKSRLRRVWGASIYLVCLMLALVVGPVLLFGAPVGLGRFLVAYAACAIMTYLVALLTPMERADTR